MNFFDHILKAKNRRLLIGGHRGHQSQTRENTIANFAELSGSGVDYIEIDIQLSKDEQAVIYHDKELSEKTSLNGRVRDYTVTEMKEVFELCTLDETICWCKANRMCTLLEIKSKDYNERERTVLGGKIADSIRSFSFADQCMLLSIDYEILKIIKEAVPEIHLALIVPSIPDDPVRMMKEMKASVYLSYLDDLNKTAVEQLQRNGFVVDGSVVNTEKDLQKALGLGVDMIESDYPEMIMKIYQSIPIGDE